MTREDVAEIAGEEELLFLGSNDGEYDHTIVGVTTREGYPVLVYDTFKIVEYLEHCGMSFEDAWEWFNFNIEGSHMGDRTPIYLTPINFPPIIH